MIIGMVGMIGSGKGTVGDYLHEGKGFYRESFAKPLKDAIAIIFNWPRHLLEGDTPESRKWRDEEDPYWTRKLGWKVTPRSVLQKMGTEAGREVFGYELWTASLINRLKPNKDYVITDVRFANEINALYEMNSVIIRVKRGPEPDWFEHAQWYLKYKPRETLFNFAGKDVHISEYGWVNSRMDYVIPNDGTIEELYMHTDAILTQLTAGA
jgi:hypothetical protein